MIWNRNTKYQNEHNERLHPHVVNIVAFITLEPSRWGGFNWWETAYISGRRTVGILINRAFYSLWYVWRHSAEKWTCWIGLSSQFETMLNMSIRNCVRFDRIMSDITRIYCRNPRSQIRKSAWISWLYKHYRTIIQYGKFHIVFNIWCLTRLLAHTS